MAAQARPCGVPAVARGGEQGGGEEDRGCAVAEGSAPASGAAGFGGAARRRPWPLGATMERSGRPAPPGRNLLGCFGDFHIAPSHSLDSASCLYAIIFISFI